MCATIRTKAIINRVLLIIIIQQRGWGTTRPCGNVVSCMPGVCQVYVVYAESITTLIDVLIEDGC